MPSTQVTRIPKKEPDTAAAHRRSKPYTKEMIRVVSSSVTPRPIQMGLNPFRYRGTSSFHRASTVSTKEKMARSPVRPANSTRNSTNPAAIAISQGMR